VETIRQRIIKLLEASDMTARDLSQVIGIREREVYDHLPHIARSLTAQNRRLIIQPFQCLECGYVFRDRQRLTRPSRCPRCRQSRIQEAVYGVS
jgi:predicted Zn-ribbon and HTH transcriptional regulator